MKNILLTIVLLSFYFFCYSQSVDTLTCRDLILKGYKQIFCDYNTKYAYKNIPFESSLDLVSSKFKLTKHPGSAKQYDCTDDDMLTWATVTFDNCIFEFSSNNKLNGVQLQISRNSPTLKAYIKEKMQIVKTYLTTYFGEPETVPWGSSLIMWRGNKLHIVMSDPENTYSVVVAIFRNNTNAIDDL